MTKKIIDENTTDLKFKNFNFAKIENFSSADINIANFMSASIVAVLADSENDAISIAFASTFSEKFYLYKLQNC
jgi:hypothetical protein